MRRLIAIILLALTLLAVQAKTGWFSNTYAEDEIECLDAAKGLPSDGWTLFYFELCLKARGYVNCGEGMPRFTEIECAEMKRMGGPAPSPSAASGE